MRGQALLAIGVLVAGLGIAQPASAEPYRNGATASPEYTRTYEECRAQQNRRAVGGAVIGALAGAVFGNNVASGGHQGDGTALGAVLGGAAGAAIGHGTARCEATHDAQAYRSDRYGRNDGYAGQDRYGRDDELEGGPDGSYDPRGGDRNYRRTGYGQQQCQWQDVRVRDRWGRTHTQDAYMCLGRDGVWRRAG